MVTERKYMLMDVGELWNACEDKDDEIDRLRAELEQAYKDQGAWLDRALENGAARRKAEARLAAVIALADAVRDGTPRGNTKHTGRAHSFEIRAAATGEQ